MRSYPYVLATITYAAGTRSIVSLRELPKKIADYFTHLRKLQFKFTATPTFGANDVDGPDLNKMFNVEFSDGSVTRFNGDLNTLRALERMQNGRVRNADPDEGATTAARYWSKSLWMGPPQFKNGADDFAIPAGQLENGQLVISHRALGDIDADLSALTGEVQIIAHLRLRHEIVVPPCYVVTQEDFASKTHQMTGRCRYESIALLNDSAHGVIAAGDFSDIRLDLGRGDIIPTVAAEALREAFLDDFNVGEFGGVLGEPHGSTDDNNKQANRESATALEGVPADLQPVLWSPPGSKLNQLWDAESVAKLSYSGSQSGATALYGRFLDQPDTVIATNATKALQAAGITSFKGLDAKTLDKKKIDPRMPKGYLPWKVQL